MSVKLYFLPAEEVERIKEKNDVSDIVKQLKVMRIKDRIFYVVECDVDQNGNDILPDLIFSDEDTFRMFVNKAIAFYVVDLR